MREIFQLFSVVLGWLLCVVLQEPWGFRECAGRSAGRPGGLPGFSAAGQRLLHWHLGLSVLPRHCKLPVFLTKGELTAQYYRTQPKMWNRDLLLQRSNLIFFCQAHDSSFSKVHYALEGTFNANGSKIILHIISSELWVKK